MTKRIIGSISLLAVAFGLIMLAYNLYITHRALNSPLITAGQPLIIEIKPNSSAFALLHDLKQKGLIHSEQVLLNYIKWKKLAGQIKKGFYVLNPGDSALDFLNKVIQGKVLSQSFTIIEGTTLEQILKQLHNAPYLDFNATDLATISVGYPSAEGLLLADTYQYDAGSDAKIVLQQANKSLLNVLNEAWLQRSPELPYANPYQLLIVASILEKEASIAQEKKIISGVIINRLHKNMPLQMDPTVIYAMKDNYHGKLNHTDLSINSPYNTYRYKGLPPGPIAMVGKDAIWAAAQPQSNSYLYYVAKGDGTHYFSTNYEEQRRAINRYLIKGH